MQRIFLILEKSQGMYPAELIEEIKSLESYHAQEKQPEFQKNSTEVRSIRAIRWLEELAKSQHISFVHLALDLAKKFLETDPSRVSLAYTLVKRFSENSRIFEAIKMMEFLQSRKAGRSMPEEIDAFCSIIAAMGKGPAYYKSMGQISQRIVRKWSAKSDESPRDPFTITEFLKAMWGEAEYTSMAVQTFKEMIKKGFLTGELITGEYWLEACSKALENPACGLSAAFDVWHNGLKSWKSTAANQDHIEFCIKLLQAFQKRKMDDEEMYTSTILNELFNSIHSLKETDYDRFEAIVSQIKNIQTYNVKNSLVIEFLIRLQLSELAHFIQEKEWRLALNLFKTILENDSFKAIDKSYFLTLSVHLENFIHGAALDVQDIPVLVQIAMNKFLEKKVFDGRLTTYISILSSSLVKIADSIPHSKDIDQLLAFILRKAECADDLIPCAAIILEQWQQNVKTKEDLGKIYKPDFLFKAFIKGGQNKELAALILFLKQHRLLEKISEGVLINAWGCLERLSLSPDFSDLQLCREAFDVLLEAAAFIKDSKEPVRILKNLQSSDHPFNFTESFKRMIPLLGENLKDVEEIIEILQDSKNFVSLFYLFQALSRLPLSPERLEKMWMDLYGIHSNCGKGDPAEFAETVELYALRYSEKVEKFSQPPEKILYNALKARNPIHFETILTCLSKHKVISIDLWNAVILNASPKTTIQICNTFKDVLQGSGNGTRELQVCWKIFFEAALQLPLSAWLQVMHGLPENLNAFETLDPSYRSLLYNKLLKKGMERLLEKETNQFLLTELWDLRKKITPLKPSFFEPKEVEFVGRMIDEGGLEKAAEAAYEIKEYFEKHFEDDANGELFFSFTSKLCSRLLQGKSDKQRQEDLVNIENAILDLFRNAILRKKHSSKNISILFKKIISTVSALKMIETVQFILNVIEVENREGEWFPNHIEAIVKRLMRFNTPDAFQMAFKLLESFKIQTPKKAIPDLLHYAARSREPIHKEKALTLFCENYSSLAEEENIKALEEAAASCLGSIPQSKESWALFIRMMAQVFNLMYPIIKEKNWEHTLENPLDQELPLILFGEILEFASNKEINEKFATASHPKKRMPKIKMKNLPAEEIEKQNIYRSLIKVYSALVNHLTNEEIFEKTDPMIILSGIKNFSLQANDFLMRRNFQDPTTLDIYENLENLHHRFTFDIAFIEKENISLHYDFVFKLDEVFIPEIKHESQHKKGKYFQRNLYFIGLEMLKALNAGRKQRIKNHRCLPKLLLDLLDKRKKSSFLRTLLILWDIKELLPTPTHEIHAVYKAIFNQVQNYIDGELEEISVISYLGSLVIGQIEEVLTKDLDEEVTKIDVKHIDKREKESLIKMRKEWALNFFIEFFNLSVSIYQKRGNAQKVIKHEKNSTPCSFKEFILAFLKGGLAAHVFDINREKYRELFNCAMTLP